MVVNQEIFFKFEFYFFYMAIILNLATCREWRTSYKYGVIVAYILYVIKHKMDYRV